VAARSKARQRALQILFEADQRGSTAPDVLADWIRLARTDERQPPVSEYTMDLVRGYAERGDQIDDLLATQASLDDRRHDDAPPPLRRPGSPRRRRGQRPHRRHKFCRLAAPQIGVQKQVVVWDFGDDPQVIFNPEISEADGEWLYEEGCLSIPGLYVEIARPKTVLVRGVDLDGNPTEREVDELMARATEEMNAGRYSRAVSILTDVTKRKPDFAEGWNRRATVYYLAGEYEKSIADCHEVLKRNPRHFGALSGMGQIYFQLEDWAKALEWYRKALEVNPNMLGVEMNIRLLEEKLKAPGKAT
jgi:tetratricopeptide (TPR) repeat protein